MATGKKIKDGGMTAEEGSGGGRVSVAVPRCGEREDPNLFVGINGVNYLLPRGKKSVVPASVALELDRAEAARDKMEDYRDLRRDKA